MRSGNGRHRRPRQAPALFVTAGVTGAGLALPLLGATGAHAADGATWDKVAECESGGLWSANENNGYYGGLQLPLDTWEEFGGTDFAERPDLASRGQQISVGEKMLDKQGVQAFPNCAVDAGLTEDSAQAPDVDPGGILGEPSDAPSDDAPSDEPSDAPSDEPSSAPSDEPSGAPSDDTPAPESGSPTAPDPSPSTDDKAPAPDDSSAPSGTASPSDTAPPSPSDTAPPSDSPTAEQPDKGGRPDESTGEPSGDSSTDPGTGSSTDPGTGSGADTGSGTGKHRGQPDEHEQDGHEQDGHEQGGHLSRGGHVRDGDEGDGKDADGTYRVRPGESLSGIAAEHGVRDGWPGLYEQNRDVVGSDPDLIRPGQQLRL